MIKLRQIILTKTASKQLAKLNKGVADRIVLAIKGLREHPMVGDLETIKGQKNRMRLRIGSYRVLFDLQDDKIIISDIGTRGDIYK